MSLNGTQRQWINLGIHPEFCLANKYGCGNEGAAMSLWLKMPDCSRFGTIISNVDGVSRRQGSGFRLECYRGLR